jgi:aspartate kinase
MTLRENLDTLRVKRTETMLTIIGVPDVPGTAAQLFQELAVEGIAVGMIVQNAPESGSAPMTFTVGREDGKRALEVTRRCAGHWEAEGLMEDERIARLSVLGRLLEEKTGVAGKLFAILAENDINVLAINTTLDTLSCVIDDGAADKAARLLCDQLNLKLETV